jgi:hypothetical protein
MRQNSFFKKFATIVMLVATSVVIYADTATYGPNTTAITSLIGRGAKIADIVFSNGATNAITVTFTDSPTNTLTYVTSAYTNNLVTTGTTVVTYTNILGVVQNMTNTTQTTTLSVQGALTNNYRTFLIQTVPASGSVTYRPSAAQPVVFGLAGSSTATNVTATITYTPSR